MKLKYQRYVRIGLTGFGIVAAGLLFFFLLFRFAEVKAALSSVMGIVTPFIYGAVIAYILAPLCNRIETTLMKLLRLQERKGWIATIAIVVSLVLLIAIIWVLVLLVIPQVWDSVLGIAAAVPGQLASANSWLHRLLQQFPELQTYWDQAYLYVTTGTDSLLSKPDGLEDWLKNDVLPNVGTVMSGVGTGVAAFLNTVKNLFLGLLISIYFLASRKQFAAQGKMLLSGIFRPHWADLVEEEFRYADRMFNGFLMGKLLDSAIIGALCFIGTTILGFESAALISVVIGVTNIIPFFGPLIGAIPCLLLLLLEDPMHALYFLIFIILLQQLDGNLIGPKILGNSTGLSSFWVLFSILLFGGLWGFVGMLVGVPLFAVIYDIIRKLTFYGLHQHERAEMIDTYNAAFHPEPLPKKPRQKKEKVKKAK